MKNALYVGSLSLVLCLLFVSPAVATSVEFLGNHEEVWLVRSDDVVAHYENMIWRPPVKKGKRDIHDEDNPGLACLNNVVPRAICWRMDAGQPDNFNWTVVKALLNTNFGRKIGELYACTVVGDVEAPECYRVTADVYTVYIREQYRVTYDGNTAEISVLVPTSGLGVVYSDLNVLGLHSCIGALPPQAASATCASIRGHPLTGEDCLNSGPRTKKDFEDRPLLGETPERETTWGRIKSLYED